MNILRPARTIATALTAFPALLLCVFADDLDDVWEPFLDEAYR